ncbi:hypothetical protein VNO80_05293 [Phaseolus coccineus]|uniref:Uncharacterized protein n=1 Tax=Phaseolus coccineus TaxID=3886 RepID=A0AAN9NFB0_PHACN
MEVDLVNMHAYICMLAVDTVREKRGYREENTKIYLSQSTNDYSSCFFLLLLYYISYEVYHSVNLGFGICSP